MAMSHIELEGVCVHNLKNVNVRIRRNALTVICGVSGSGKSSLAFDTLFAEGQRRYIETFSPAARQFLDRIERPAADRIDGIPPAIAIRQNQRRAGPRSTVGTRTEIIDYLRLVMARLGAVICPSCRLPVRSDSAESAATQVLSLHPDARAMIAFPVRLDRSTAARAEGVEAKPAAAVRPDQKKEIAGSPDSGITACRATIERLQQRGFSRILANGRTIRLEDIDAAMAAVAAATTVDVLLDRIRLTADAQLRLTESLETALHEGDGACVVFCECPETEADPGCRVVEFDGRPFAVRGFTTALVCAGCERAFQPPSPEMLNFNSPLGACPTCEGNGAVSTMVLERVVPDDGVTLRDGAIAAWTTPAYRHELEELLALATDYGIPADIPFRELTADHRDLIIRGIPERNFGGLQGFHDWLVRHRYKQGARAVLNRWRTWRLCSHCSGTRLAGDAQSVCLNGQHIGTLAKWQADELLQWVQQLHSEQPQETQTALRVLFHHLLQRLRFLVDCGLGYLSLDRAISTLSGGESQRVMLTAALGAGLIHTLYVLDEPTAGLHSQDTTKVIAAARRLQRMGNTVVVVEHDAQFIAEADEVIEVGPEAGEHGGAIVFQGSVSELQTADTATGRMLKLALVEAAADKADWQTERPTDSNADVGASPQARRKATEHLHRATETDSRHWLKVAGVCCHNVNALDVCFPLNAFSVVTGVSGSGKSSLIVDALYPALCKLLKQSSTNPAEHSVSSVSGYETFDRVLLLDQSPLQKSSRSIPATWVGAFDEIRRVLTETFEARKRNYPPGMFSFNSARGGRCPVCEGLGVLTIEMQFLADIHSTCDECRGRRFRPEVLEVRYRDRTVAEILNMTVNEAFVFFHGQARIQQRLNGIRQAGLGYIRLGQPLSTLSGGEAQRLRIAALLSGVPSAEHDIPLSGQRIGTTATGRNLFILDEPSTGLHMQDIDRLVSCLRLLVQTGHTVIVVEHDEYFIRHADYRVELGPGAGREGGRIVRAGFCAAAD